MTLEQIDHHFTFHPPTDDTKPKYNAVRAAENACHELFSSLSFRIDRGAGVIQPLTASDCDLVNVATKAFAVAINDLAPSSADQNAAYRCVRLARNGANEFIMANVAGFPLQADSLRMAREQLVLARWQACGAIACRGL